MIGWVDATAGASGDMLLGAVIDAGAPLAALQRAVDAVGVERVRLQPRAVTRHGLAAVHVDIDVARSSVTRTWGNLRDLLERAALPDPVRVRALEVFARLARAEARVHRTEPEQVHFHEVGALDALADVVGFCAGLHELGVGELSSSQVTLGSGMSRSEHGLVPVPAPAVLELLAEAGAPTWAGPAPYEMCTPTGAALLAAHVTSWGPLPPMTVRVVGCGAGTRDLDEVPNILRLVLGEPADAAGHEAGAGPETALVLECNVDDLDPRLWPGVLDRLLAAGASDAWLTPILMKKGRPAHTLRVLCPPALADELRRLIFASTSTIGLRELSVHKRTLAREVSTVDVGGHPVRVKVARSGSEIVNASVEYADVAATAAALGRPEKAVLADATAAARSAGLLP